MVWTDHIDPEEEAFNEVEESDFVVDEEGFRISLLIPSNILLFD